MIIGISKAYDLSIHKHNNKILNMQYELQLKSFNELEKYQTNVRKISHDINNHKIILYNFIKNTDYDAALNYLESLDSNFNSSTSPLYSNHKILNALLSSKQDICESNNINFLLDIRIPSSISISDFDLCVIVGNLLDNAIEACKKLSHSNKKAIEVKAKIINENFVFEIKNTYSGVIQSYSKKIISTKKDKLNHGLGLSNIKSTVEKYNGNFNLIYDSNEFTALAIIPLR